MRYNFEENIAVLCSKTLQNDSKGVEKLTKSEVGIHYAINGIFADFGWKMAEN